MEALEDAQDVDATEDEDRRTSAEADEIERPPNSLAGLEGRRSALRARDKDMDQAPTTWSS
jgi:hypothetical protein